MWVLQRAYQNIILDTATGIQKFWDGQIRPLPIIGPNQAWLYRPPGRQAGWALPAGHLVQ